ncbi:MAG: carbon-nitrogen hydrolase [Methylococcaceae bacterium]|nr:MAG: carbon-nitrogen hydrolase [Methylococcaceae bacterium]
MTVALAQQSFGVDRDKNLADSIAFIHAAKQQGADLVLLPELHLGPYFCQSESTDFFDLAEPIPGPSCETLGALAGQLNIVIVATLFEKRAPGLYHNTAVVFDRDGSMAGKYRKMHIPDDPGFYEKFYFTPGDLGFTPIATSLGKVGILVCWDQWYPEAARLMAMAGAELLLYPTAIGWSPDDDADEKQRQLDAWITIQRAHAVANGLPVLSCNRMGFEPDPSGHSSGIQFWGNSFVTGPQGELLCSAGSDESKLLIVAIDRARTESVRRIWPFLRDRRIDAFDGLVKRYLD